MSKFLKPGAFRAVDVDSVDSYLNTLLAGLKLLLVINCAFCDACRFTAWHWLHNKNQLEQTH